MNAWYDGKDSLTAGSFAASVTVSAVSSMCRAWPASTWRNAYLPSAPRWLLASRQWSSSLLTREVTQPSLIIPSAL
jgi:hypothetical protein